MITEVIGYSTWGQPIWAYGYGSSHPKKRMWVIGGTHGNEVEGVVCIEALRARLLKEQKLDQILSEAELVLIPNINPDGVYKLQRVNAQNVDLNRNLPTKDWNPKTLDPKYPPGPSPASEPETQVLLKLLESRPPNFVISVHSFSNFMINTNANCEPVASEMQKINQYPIEPSIGYPTPGSLGTYLGMERSIPTITYEIERGLDFESICKVHVEAVWKGILSWAQ